MDAATSFLASQSKQDMLLGCLIFQAICVFPLIICAFVVSNTANMGFNCVLTSFLDLAYFLGTFYVVRNSKAPIAVSAHFNLINS
ncbi:hypothetical protein EON64_19370 [archaeon]|nr:MAG: hypothetical protein EON64_19370 [archaeon]